jgi:hypothetical protein
MGWGRGRAPHLLRRRSGDLAGDRNHRRGARHHRGGRTKRATGPVRNDLSPQPSSRHARGVSPTHPEQTDRHALARSACSPQRHQPRHRLCAELVEGFRWPVERERHTRWRCSPADPRSRCAADRRVRRRARRLADRCMGRMARQLLQARGASRTPTAGPRHRAAEGGRASAAYAHRARSGSPRSSPTPIPSRSASGRPPAMQSRTTRHGSCGSSTTDSPRRATSSAYAPLHGFTPISSAISRHFQAQSTSSNPIVLNHSSWVCTSSSWFEGSSFSIGSPMAS